MTEVGYATSFGSGSPEVSSGTQGHPQQGSLRSTKIAGEQYRKAALSGPLGFGSNAWQQARPTHLRHAPGHDACAGRH